MSFLARIRMIFGGRWLPVTVATIIAALCFPHELAPLFLLAFGLVRWAAWFLFYKLPSMMLDGDRRQDPLPPPEDKP